MGSRTPFRHITFYRTTCCHCECSLRREIENLRRNPVHARSATLHMMPSTSMCDVIAPHFSGLFFILLRDTSQIRQESDCQENRIHNQNRKPEIFNELASPNICIPHQLITSHRIAFSHCRYWSSRVRASQFCTRFQTSSTPPLASIAFHKLRWL